MISYKELKELKNSKITFGKICEIVLNTPIIIILYAVQHITY